MTSLKTYPPYIYPIRSIRSIRKTYRSYQSYGGGIRAIRTINRLALPIMFHAADCDDSVMEILKPNQLLGKPSDYISDARELTASHQPILMADWRNEVKVNRATVEAIISGEVTSESKLRALQEKVDWMETATEQIRSGEESPLSEMTLEGVTAHKDEVQQLSAEAQAAAAFESLLPNLFLSVFKNVDDIKNGGQAIEWLQQNDPQRGDRFYRAWLDKYAPEGFVPSKKPQLMVIDGGLE